MKDCAGVVVQYACGRRLYHGAAWATERKRQAAMRRLDQLQRDAPTMKCPECRMTGSHRTDYDDLKPCP